MSGHSPEEMKQHVRVYLWVFVSLLVLTVVTVAVSYFEMSIAAAIIVALIVASLKGGLVAGYFMHLIGERKIISYTLILTLVFFLFLLLIPLLTDLDNVVV